MQSFFSAEIFFCCARFAADPDSNTDCISRSEQSREISGLVTDSKKKTAQIFAVSFEVPSLISTKIVVTVAVVEFSDHLFGLGLCTFFDLCTDICCFFDLCTFFDLRANKRAPSRPDTFRHRISASFYRSQRTCETLRGKVSDCPVSTRISRFNC